MDLTKDSVLRAQRSDPDLLPVIQILEKQKNGGGEDQGPVQKISDFSLKEMVLYKNECVVIPKVLQNAVLVECHCKPIAGHLGRKKTLQRLKSMGLWWSGMSQSVRSFIRSCKVCLQTKPSYQRRQGKMLSSTSSRPWGKGWCRSHGAFAKVICGA